MAVFARNKINLFSILFGIVIVISCLTHFYRINNTFIFQNDEARDSLIAYKMISQKKPVLLGPETSVGNMYLGPFYYYLMVAPLAITKLDPVGPAIMVGLFAVFTTAMLMIFAKKWYGGMGAIASGFFYAISPIMVHYSRSSWNPNIVPLFALTLLILYKKPSRYSDFFSGVVTGILFQLHYVALALPAILGLLRLKDIFSQTDPRHKFHELAIFLLKYVLGFILITAPLWIFEFRHDFVNTQAFITYIREKSLTANSPGQVSYLTRLIKNLNTFIIDLVNSSPVISSSLPLWLKVLSVLMFIGLLFTSSGKFLLLIITASLIIVSVLRENIYVHYLGFLFPLVALSVGSNLSSKRIILKLLVAIFLVATVFRSLPALSYNIGELTDSQVTRAKQVANYIVNSSQGRGYNVVNASTSSSAQFEYYLAISSNPPKNSDQSLLFLICLDEPCPDDVLTRRNLYISGASHPSLTEYLGYTPRLDFDRQGSFISNNWIAYNVWVAEVKLDP